MNYYFIVKSQTGLDYFKAWQVLVCVHFCVLLHFFRAGLTLGFNLWTIAHTVLPASRGTTQWCRGWPSTLCRCSVELHVSCLQAVGPLPSIPWHVTGIFPSSSPSFVVPFSVYLLAPYTVLFANTVQNVAIRALVLIVIIIALYRISAIQVFKL